MKSEKSHSGSDKSHFAGCIEHIAVRPVFIEFATAQQLWGIPIQQLEFFTLKNNPEAEARKTSPTDLLILVFQTRIVLLLGWRLELMLGPLMEGRVKRVHAEKHLGALMIGEPWVSEIIVAPRDTNIPI